MKPYVPITQLQNLVLSTSLPIPPANYFEAKLQYQFISSIILTLTTSVFLLGLNYLCHQRYTISTLATTFSVNIC